MQPIFIVAQYKCGTRWLLSALAFHPHVVGLKEIDIVRAAHGIPASLAAMDLPRRFIGRNAWSREDISFDLEAGRHPEPEPRDWSRVQTIEDLPHEAAVGLYQSLKQATKPEEAMDAFLRFNVMDAPDHLSHLVLKAADQIRVFDLLQRWQPDAPKIAITRDGRDAAISAIAYRRLMREQGAPWVVEETDYFTQLKSWADRVRMILDRVRSGELYLLRYEDLSEDFKHHFGKLLEHLGLESSPALVEEIEAATSFEAKTGRPRGVEKRDILRKGAVGEWREKLSPGEQDRAWELVGDELEALGYSRT